MADNEISWTDATGWRIPLQCNNDIVLETRTGLLAALDRIPAEEGPWTI
jgi:hypothetical protein